MLPPLVLELTAYVPAALAGIFASKAVGSYPFEDHRLRRVLRAAAAIRATAVGLLSATAAPQSVWAPLLLPAG